MTLPRFLHKIPSIFPFFPHLFVNFRVSLPSSLPCPLRPPTHLSRRALYRCWWGREYTLDLSNWDGHRLGGVLLVGGGAGDQAVVGSADGYRPRRRPLVSTVCWNITIVVVVVGRRSSRGGGGLLTVLLSVVCCRCRRWWWWWW